MFHSCFGIHGNNSFKIPRGGSSSLKGFSACFSSQSFFNHYRLKKKKQEKHPKGVKFQGNASPGTRIPTHGFVFLLFGGFSQGFGGAWLLGMGSGRFQDPEAAPAWGWAAPKRKNNLEKPILPIFDGIFPWIQWLGSSQEGKITSKSIFPYFWALFIHDLGVQAGKITWKKTVFPHLEQDFFHSSGGKIRWKTHFPWFWAGFFHRASGWDIPRREKWAGKAFFSLVWSRNFPCLGWTSSC